MRPIASVLATAFVVAGLGAPPAQAGVPFGFNENYLWSSAGVSPQQKIRLTQKSGARLARTALDWRCVEPHRGGWNEGCWAAYARFYERSLRRGIRPLFTLISPPRWAWAHPCRRRISRTCAMPPAQRHDEAWRRFAAEAAKRFPRGVFEIWNEPNLKVFWNGRPQPWRYAELVKIASRAINRQSDRATVIAGAVVATDRRSPKVMGATKYLSNAFGSPHRLRAHIDGLSFHSYGLSQGLRRDSYFPRSVRKMRAIARRHLPPRRTRLWITETGASTGPPESFTRKQQRALLWQAYRHVAKLRLVRGLIFHRLVQPRDSDPAPWQLGVAWTRYRPPHRSGPIRPRPVFCRFARRVGEGYRPCRRV